MVDRDADCGWRWRWVVPVDHPAFDGHFPGQPVVPGVVLLAQVLERLRARGVDTAGLTLRQSKFLARVGPGATLDFTVTPGAGAWRYEVHEGARLAASGAYARD